MQRKDISPERKTIILVVVLFLNLVLMSTRVVMKNEKSLLNNIIGLIAAPFKIGFQKGVDLISHKIRRYIFHQHIFDKYTAVRKEQVQLKYENYLLKKKIMDEAFLERLKELGADYLETDVISIDPNFPFANLTIDRGSSDGIRKDMVVLNTDTQLVGRITEPISPITSRVRLITNSVGGAGAYIKKNMLEGFLTGENSKICLFKYLLENKPVDIGDEVVSSGTDGIFPAYLSVGTVIRIEKEYLVQKVYVKPYFIEKPIKKLFIIRNKTHE